jgi:two-component system nitrate/nitrite response regulator NarL
LEINTYFELFYAKYVIEGESNMKSVIISDSLIIRKGIAKILEDEGLIDTIKESDNILEINNDEYDLILVELKKENEDYLEEIINRKKNINCYVMILDFNKNKNLFNRCMKLEIDGYILANTNSDDLGYAVRQLLKGKKYYDSDLIRDHISHNNLYSSENLTKREYEILSLIARGKSNLEISKELFITENTVKKHTSNILAKLNLKDRTQVAVFAYHKGIVNL